MKVRIIPYKRGSKSAKVLASKLTNLLGYKVWRGKPRKNRANLFWGWVGELSEGNWNGWNSPNAIKKARDKLLTFQELQGHVPIPEFTTDKTVAEGWLLDGKTVFARTRTGQGGSGIHVCGDTLVDAPLYTLYVKKKKEFRVHVAHGRAILVQQKRKRRGFIGHDTFVRSHKRGWTFCRLDIEEPDDLRDVAIRAVDILGLDFGAVDVIWNAKRNQCYVLEVNTAPGLCNQTGDLYANQFVETY